MNRREPQNKMQQDQNAACFVIPAGILCIAFAVIATRNELDSPFVWFDVTMVYLVCSLLFGTLLAQALLKFLRMPRMRVVLLGALVFLATLLVASQARYQPSWMSHPTTHMAIDLARTLLALAAASAATVLVMGVMNRVPLVVKGPRSVEPQKGKGVVLLTAVVCATLVPLAYSSAKQSRMETQLVELLEQYRLNKAAQLAGRLRRFSPWSELKRRTIAEVAVELEARVAELRSSIVEPLAADADSQQRLERARCYAVLDDLESTARTLAPLLLSDRPPAAACLLLATAYESQSEWDASLAWYQRARAELLRSRDDRPTSLDMVRALKGIGYTQRKRGQNRAAETAYQQLLALAPTAETHFLLARFYEDGQQSALAREHAAAALRLDPQQYGESARALLDHVATAQFGCLSGMKGDR